ncbi:MAG: hypothetical protein PVG71_09455, partial [Anaerolineae bacterium]
RSIQMSPVLYQYDADGSLLDPHQLALETFKRILDTHEPQPLPREVQAELARILMAAEGEEGHVGPALHADSIQGA